MDTGTARRIVLISMLLTGAVVVYDLSTHKEKLGPGDQFRAVWSLSLLFLLEAIMADVVPGLAGPFAGLVTLSVLVGRGAAVNSIVSIGGKATRTAAATTGVTVKPVNTKTNSTPPTHPGTNP